MALNPSDVPSRAGIVGADIASASMGSGWGGAVSASRRADVVMVTLAATKASWSAGETVATIPVGYRPSATRRGAVLSTGSGDAVMVAISTAGVVTLISSGTTGLSGNVLYLDI